MIPLTVLLMILVVLLLNFKNISMAIRDRLHIYRVMSTIPGPVALPLIGTVWQFKWDVAGISKQLIEWGTYYTKQGHSAISVWIGPKPVVFIITPEAAKELLESNTVITKADEYSILFPWLGTGLLTSTGEKWKARRKMLTPAFHFKKLNEFITTHDYQAKVMLDQIKQFAISGEEFDMFPYIKRMALDIICETSMGTTVDAQHNHDHQYVMSVQRLNEIAFEWSRKPWIKPKPLWYLSGIGFEYDKHLKIVTDFTRKLWNEGKLDFEDVREEVDTFMFEGHDTTSSSMGWTLWAVAHDPEVQAKIHEEMDQIFGGSDRDCTNEDLKQMKYLEKCIKESLRMFPSVPMFARKIEEDVEFHGCPFPKGCTAVILPILIHRNETFWDHPNKYNPDNFSEESLASKHAYADVPFSAGPRNCIGQKFAVMEEKTCLSWFFRTYRVSSTRNFDDNLPQPEIIIKPSLGFPLRVHLRD